jgi:MoaA/NifB/PqqE/SkfB family radical SAM enzyme
MGKSYTTDGRVVHLTTEEDVNQKISKVLGKKFVHYRKKWDLVNKLSLITEFPLFLHIELNQTCNYKCPHCIIGNPDEVSKLYNKEENLTFKQYKKIVDEGAEYNCPSITAQGDNEPFLIKNMEEYIYHAHKKGFIDIMTNTNGSPITPKRSQQILDSGLTRLRFSLDAFTDKTYKKVRVGAIDLEKVKKNIFTFLELKEKGGYKLPIVGVSFCKLKNNQHELEKFKNYWKDKVDLVSVQTFVPPTQNKKAYLDFYPEDQFYDEENKNFRCNQPFQRIQIRNHEMFPCCYSLVMGDKGTKNYKNFVLGNINDTSIYDAWNGSKMKELRKIQIKGKFKKNPTCATCVKHTYPTKNFSLKGSINS